MSTSPNADEAAYWNNEGGARWSDRAPLTDRVFGPLTQGLLARARPAPGERVLDIGCGCGGSTFAVARAVGPRGSVLGVDLSRPMLAIAQTREEGRDLAHVRFVEGDAATYAFEAAAHDLAISRFGVMFFPDPVAAFTNIRRGVAGGRLTFICWRDAAANPWQTVPAKAVEDLLPPAPERRGRTSFADPERTRAVLHEAGFTNVEIEPHDADLPLGTTPDEAAEVAISFGSLGPRMATVSSEVRAQVHAAIARALLATTTPAGVTLRAGTWIVSASG